MRSSQALVVFIAAISLALNACGGSLPDIETHEINHSYIESESGHTIRSIKTESRADSRTLPSKPELNDFLLFALGNNAALKSAYLQYQALLEKSGQVSTLPDPQLSYSYFIDQVETRVGPQEHRAGVMQQIPWFGKLNLKGEIADLEAEAAFYNFLAKKNELLARVVDVYYELAYLEHATSITEANLELLKRWEQVIAQRYRTHSGTQADLIKAQVELGKLEDKLKELQDSKTPLVALFNSVLNRSNGEDVNVPVESLDPPYSSNEHPLEYESLRSVLIAHNPELRLFDSLIEAKKRGIDLANKNYYPDFTVGADYIFVGEREMAGSESGDDALVTMLSMSLPIYRSRYDAGLRQAKKERKSAEAMKQAKYFELNARLAKLIFEVKDSKRRIKLYEDTLVPKAEESLESTYTGFEAGETTFLDLLDAERALLDFQLSLVRARADYQTGNASLSALLGDYSEVTEKSGVLK